MPITQEELGRRLKLAREAVGMTQEDVAAHLQVSRPTVAQLEAGKRAVSSLELDLLARLLAQDIRDLLAEDFVEGDPLKALFRAQGDFVADEGVRSALRSWLGRGRELTNLENLLDMPHRLCTAALYHLPRPTSRWQAIQQGERVAGEERSRLGLGRAPVSDITDLLEGQGVRTALEALPENISGMTLKDRRSDLMVVVNSDHSPLRQRFSFAHEYAHVLVDRERPGVVSRSEDRDDLMEIRANSFAACFLMPEDGVRELVRGMGKGAGSRETAEVFDENQSVRVEGRAEAGSQRVQMYDVVQVAGHFGASRMAAIYRMKNLKLITQRELEALRANEDARYAAELSRMLGAEEPAVSKKPSAFQRRFVANALEAYRRSLISRGKLQELGELAGLSQAEVGTLRDAALAADEEEG